MGFSGSVNGTTKNKKGFLDFGFCQCKWAYLVLYLPEWASGDKILCSTLIKVRFDSNLILSTLPFSDSPFPFQSCCRQCDSQLGTFFL